MSQYRFIKKLKTAFFLFFLFGSKLSFGQPMTISIDMPTFMDITRGASVYRVYIAGTIDKDAKEKLEHILSEIPSKNIDIYFNSPGGNVQAGIKLGKFIREQGFSTFVGRPGELETFTDNKGQKLPFHRKILPGTCFSACVFAFTGGVYRFSSAESKIGVHRFHATSGATKHDLDIAQIVSAAIASHFSEMGVDHAVLTLASLTSKDEIYVLSKTEERTFNVVNDGKTPASWTIETAAGQFYLRGAQVTELFDAKALFLCGWRRNQPVVALQSLQQLGKRLGHYEKFSWNMHHSIMIDRKAHFLGKPESVSSNGGYLITVFELDRKTLTAISNAKKSIGHAIQADESAPTYMGYNIDVTSADMEKIRNFLNSCPTR